MRRFDGWRLVPWGVALGAELALARAACDAPAAWQAAVEAAGMMLAGLVFAWLRPEGWRGSAAWPGVLVALGIAVRLAGWPWALVVAPVGAAVAVVLVRVLHDAEAKLRRPAARLGWAVAVPAVLVVAARFAWLVGAPVARPHLRLAEELAAPWRSADPPPGPGGPPLVVLSVDTLRADHAVRTETWRWLAARGRAWPRAMSTASWTVPALASLWTGLPPAEHGAGRRPEGGYAALREEAAPLAEVLRRRGYRAAAFVANPFVTEELGFQRGFSVFVNPDEHPAFPLLLAGLPRGLAGVSSRDGARVVDRALAWLAAAPDDGWLLWVHLFDPHLPYEHAPAGSLTHTITDLEAVRRGAMPPGLPDAVRRDYAAEVARADAAALRLLRALDDRGFFSRGTLVFAADHGEELWDHGGFEHGHTHHREVTDVALAVVSPGLPPGPGAGVASLVDVAPTLRAAAGLAPAAGPGFDLRAPLPADRVATAAGNLYGAMQRSARDGRWKAILTEPEPEEADGAGSADGASSRDGGRADPSGAADGERVEVYDLASDPGEARPLPAETPGAEAVVAAARAARTAAAGRARAAVNDAALRALGYTAE